MRRQESRIEWQADGQRVQLGVTCMGEGPEVILLPAPSSISARAEMAFLGECLADRFSTISIDWPGFGDLPRPRLRWRPEVYRAFLEFLCKEIGQPSAVVAAGHAAGYALAHGAAEPGSMGRLCLLSPTWRGPLPTMTGRRIGAFKALADAVDLPLIGPVLYRLNVNSPIIHMMARGHVYADPAFLTAERFAGKRMVTEAEGARHASFRFVAGELDPFASREDFLQAAARTASPVLVVLGRNCPRKSRAEMMELGKLANVETIEIPYGKLSFYEEYPRETAEAIMPFLSVS